ncbi:hypothetical protein BHM03_00054077, partial [Ensete ventricosum]
LFCSLLSHIPSNIWLATVGEKGLEGSTMSMEEEGSGGEVAAPAREVLLISAGASHSVALLCELKHRFLMSIMSLWKVCLNNELVADCLDLLLVEEWHHYDITALTFCYFLKAGNAMCSWGRGEDGQLGHGDAEDRLFPTILSALDSQSIVSVTCGADHTTAYSELDDQVYSWGWYAWSPSYSVIFLNFDSLLWRCMMLLYGCFNLFTLMDNHQGICVKMIAAGAEHTAAVTEDGDLYGWGWGRYGNLGLGDRNDRLIPEKVASIKVLCAFFNVCFLEEKRCFAL